MLVEKGCHHTSIKKYEESFDTCNNHRNLVLKHSLCFVPMHSKRSHKSTPGLRRCELGNPSSTMRECTCGRSFVTKTCRRSLPIITAFLHRHLALPAPSSKTRSSRRTRQTTANCATWSIRPLPREQLPACQIVSPG